LAAEKLSANRSFSEFTHANYGWLHPFLGALPNLPDYVFG
jgi:hypothetical protein